MAHRGYHWNACGMTAVLLNLVGCLHLCGNRVLSETLSPGRKRAVVFERDCGATTGFSTQVSILDANEEVPNETGNVFIADGNHGEVHNLRVSTRWGSPDHLVVTFSAHARVFRRQTQVRGVKISYEEGP